MILDALLEKTGPEDTVVFVGSGLLDNPEEIAPEAGCILMLEPDPERLPALQFYAGLQDNFQLVEASLAAESGSATYHRFNMPGLDGFAGLSALKSAFAGLQEISSFQADRLSVADLVQRLPKQHRGKDILILSLVGQEGDILPALEDAGVLSRLSHVILRSMRATPEQAKVGKDPVDVWLAGCPFDRVLEVASSDPDMSVQILARNPLSDRIARQDKDLAASQNQIKELQAKLATASAALESERKAAQDRLTEAEAASQNQIKELQAKLATASATLESERKAAQDRLTEAEAASQNQIKELQAKLATASAALESERKAAQNRLTEAQATSQNQIKELQAKLATASAALESERKAAQDRLTEAQATSQNQIKELQAKLATASAALESERKAAQDRLTEAQATSQNQIKELQAKLATASAALESERKAAQDRLTEAQAATRQVSEDQRAGRRDLSVALRMQALREADLKDLQERFARLVDEKTEQDNLLHKLTVRLDSAARYLAQIESLPDVGNPKAALASSSSAKASGGKASGKTSAKASGAKSAAARKKRKARE